MQREASKNIFILSVWIHVEYLDLIISFNFEFDFLRFWNYFDF